MVKNAAPQSRVVQRAEALFYIGQYYLMGDDKKRAVNMFGRAVNTGETNLIEYHGARAELRRMGLL